MVEGRIAVAMSGGVDSSGGSRAFKRSGIRSCRLLDAALGSAAEFPAGRLGRAPGRCCSIKDLYDAREVAARLGIPYYVVDFQKEFERTVVRDFIENYKAGLTPSPCVRCNSHMKFDRLLRMAEEIQAVRVATGHYARVSYDETIGRYLLCQARDKNKDQSYFLFELSQAQLAKILFPLGDLEKEQVRQIARRHNLPVADKPESQEICFIPDGDYAAFLERHHEEIVGNAEARPFSEGRIIDSEGRVLGMHPGIHHYTIGQRRGLGIAHKSPLYVLELRPEDNTVVVGERSRLGKRRCRVIRPNWISIPRMAEPLRVNAKIRSRHKEAAATITPGEDGSVEVMFDSPQAAISPGQACVFYQLEQVVGGGWISRD